VADEVHAVVQEISIMAKRKSYRGTPDEHRKHAITYARAVQKRAKMVREALAEGDCRDALAQLSTLNRTAGRVVTHGAASYTTDLNKRMGVGTGLYKVAMGLERRIYAKCFLKRKSKR
jgi:hypothetical protein